MNFQQFVFSDDRRQRVLRHLLFWGTFMLYFCQQCFRPRAYEELFQQRTYTNAILIFCCHIPVYFLVVYSFTSYLLPLIKVKNYLGFFLLLFSIYLLALVLNYFASFILFNNLNMTVPVVNNHYTRIQNSLWQSRHAMYIGTIVLGIELAKSWHLQNCKNLAMLKANAKAEMRIEKSRIHPEWLFNALNNIKAST